MSKVKIQGNASGTGVVTLTAPNTNTDRTITLPDEDITLIGEDSSGNVGIGTDSPSSKLHVTGSQIRLQNDNGTLQHYNTAGSRYAYVATQSDGYIVDVESTGGSTFKVKSSGSEKIRVDSDGLKFNGDTSSANALDDYEEGTWTPQLKFGGNNSGMTYSQNAGTYVKVGEFVHISFRIILTSAGTSGGGASITGLPFVCKNVTGNYGAANYGFTTNWGDSNISSANLINTIDPNGSTIYLRKINTSGNYSTFGEGSFQNDTDILMTATYRV